MAVEVIMVRWWSEVRWRQRVTRQSDDIQVYNEVNPDGYRGQKREVS